MFGNPVAGVIHPRGFFGQNGELRPAGDHSFVVTSTFAEHLASGRGPGVDIGSGRCGDALLAMADFRCAQIFTDSKGARVARFDHPEFPEYQSAIAHMPSFEVWVGKTGKRGDVVGHVGSSGNVPCHCHGGMKRNGVEVDWWPLLDQNIGADMLQGTFLARVVNRKGFVLLDNTRLRAAPATGATPILATYPMGTVFFPDYIVEGGAVGNPASKRWFGMWGTTARGSEFGYMHESTMGPLATIEAPDCAAEILAAVTPLQLKIGRAQADLA